MEEVLKILSVIENTKDCLVLRLTQSKEIALDYNLPDDLKYYFENYSSIVLFENAPYSIKLLGASEFKRANPIIIGEDVESDISHNWFIIADDNNSQYITIDLANERMGYCYDSFWDRHGVVGEQPIIAKSFTELLGRLYSAKGKEWFWLDDNFESYGDAYEE